MNTNSTNNNFINCYKRLLNQESLLENEYICLLTEGTKENYAMLSQTARDISQKTFGNHIYIRGLIEFSNYCKNNCYYCGIRSGNSHAQRYRLTKEDILSCCTTGYELGLRTFVLQSGEDPFFNDDQMCDIIETIHHQFPDCAITLSLGERTTASYQKMFDAGADRYLLRHETANCQHYQQLHPKEMSFSNRMKCLQELKDIGYQVGCGGMVGSPFQTQTDLAKDLLFIQQFQPHMVGIGPFITHKDTPFADKENGSIEMTLRMLSILRIQHPHLLLPATTALSTLDSKGRIKGILAGANVIMPNLTPTDASMKYQLYDHKRFTGNEAAKNIDIIQSDLATINYKFVVDRGDSPLH